MNQQGMGMHHQNHDGNLMVQQMRQNQHRGAVNTTNEGVLNSQRWEYSDAGVINLFTFGFNILGLGLLDDSPREYGLTFPS